MKKIVFTTTCTWVGTEITHEPEEFEDDTPDSELDTLAWERALDDHAPEGDWEIVEQTP